MKTYLVRSDQPGYDEFITLRSKSTRAAANEFWARTGFDFDEYAATLFVERNAVTTPMTFRASDWHDKRVILKRDQELDALHLAIGQEA